MSWQDDPVVEAPKGGWQDDPVVDPPGKMESFARGAANNVPLLPQVIAAGKENPEAMIPGALVNGSVVRPSETTPYSENLKNWNQKAEEAKAANPKTYGAGAVTGALAPLAIPGVGEALEGAPILGNAALGAANAISNVDLTQDKGTTAKEAALGAGVGGALGAIPKAAGVVAKAIPEAVKRSVSNTTTGVLNLAGQLPTKIAKAMGITNPEEAMSVINQKLRKYFPNVADWNSSASTKLGMIQQAHEQASKAIGQVIDATTAKEGGAIPEVNQAIDKIGSESSKYNDLTSSSNQESKKELEDTAYKLMKLQDRGQMTFDNLYEVKKGLGHYYDTTKEVSPGVEKAYGIVSDAINDVLDRAHADNPAMKQGFEEAKDLFRTTSELVPALQRATTREMVQGGKHFISKAPSVIAPDLGRNLAWRGVNKAAPVGNAISKYLPGATQGTIQEISDFVNSRRKTQ